MTTITTYFVESGTGERLSDPLPEAEARTAARNAGERLIRRTTTDDVLEDETLIFDYATVAITSDDTGAERCDECGRWIEGELISTEHDPSCSLYPSAN